MKEKERHKTEWRDNSKGRGQSKKFKLIYKLIYIFLKLTFGPYFEKISSYDIGLSFLKDLF